MQIILFLFFACISSLAAVFGTQRFLSCSRGMKRNGLLFAAGMLNAFVFSILTDIVVRAGRPDFYYFSHSPGSTTCKLFGAACFCGGAWFSLLLMLTERDQQKKTVFRRLVISFLLSVCGAVILEIGYFNFRHFELIGANTTEMTFSSDRIVGQGFYFNRASWKFHPYPWNYDFHLVVYTRNTKIRNIKYDFDDGTPRTVVRIGFNDQAHQSYAWLPEQEFIRGIPRSCFVPLHTVGTTYSIALELPEVKTLPTPSDYGAAVTVTVNQPVPLSIDPVRLGMCFLSLFFISVFFPGSPLWELPLDFRSLPQIAAAAGLLLLFCGWFAWTDLSSYTGSDRSFSEQKAVLTENYSQYDRLVDALMVPRYALTETPHRYLEQLDDPYDMRQREEKAFDYPWDTVYYHGQYFVYFGVVPAAVILLPFRLLTGKYLELDCPIFGFCCLFVLGLYGIYSLLVRRYFRSISFALYFLGIILLITPLNLTWCLRRTLIYELAITSGICFAVWGIFFILLTDGNGRRRPLCFILSGICSALAVGCRPTMLFVSIVVFTVLFLRLRENRPLFSGKNFRDLFLFLLPYLPRSKKAR